MNQPAASFHLEDLDNFARVAGAALGRAASAYDAFCARLSPLCMTLLRASESFDSEYRRNADNLRVLNAKPETTLSPARALPQTDPVDKPAVRHLTDAQREVCEVLIEHGPKTAKEIATLLMPVGSMSSSAIRKRIQSLRKDGWEIKERRSIGYWIEDEALIEACSR